ncbi:MAG: hypothetical protein ABS76_15660 [Pelagibacterium sp. SCN 64-44]|nr:MAG: hypothetical protein ABS76_15660 [Pelagibacterium sp. SCN 64-44]
MKTLREKLNDIGLELDDLEKMVGLGETHTAQSFIGPNDNGLYLLRKYDREIMEFSYRDISGRVENIAAQLSAITDALESEEAQGRAAK